MTAVRLRLTLFYAGLLAFASGLVLLASYLLVRNHLNNTLDAETAHHAVASLGSQYAIAIVAVILLAAGGGWLVSGEVLAPLARAIAAQRRFVANASHELRTPLATMRASLDVAVAKPEPVPPQTLALAGRLRTELDQVDGLLDGFLTLARTQHGALADREPVSLGALAAEALSARTADIEARRLTVHTDVREDAWTQGNAVLLARMTGNVIDNAITHNVPDGSLRVVAAPESGTALLSVESGGPPLDPAQVARLGQPFQRLGVARTADGGTGLGLSIVAAVAAAHGGTLMLRARPEGGLHVAIRLPLTPPPRS